MPRLDGIDIFHGQADKGPVELGKVAAIPTWWFACKATQSTTFVDPCYHDFITAAKPLFSHRLGYHWLSSITDPNAQADWFLEKTNGAEGIGVMQDIEEKGDTVAKALAFFERTEEHTHRPGVGYSGLYVSAGSIWNSPELRQSQYGLRPFIVAAYVTEENLNFRMASLGSKPRDGWQYTSSGTIDGIVGRCDEDQIDNRAAFDKACGITVQPQEDDMLRFLAPIDSPARFYAMCDAAGRALRCEWTGDGGDQKVLDRIAFYRNAHPAGDPPFEMALTLGAFQNISLDGPMPPGFTPDQFANSAEIVQRGTGEVIDEGARGMAQRNAAAISDIRIGGQRIADAGGM